MLIRRGGAGKRHAARVVWLQARPERYRTAPGIGEDVTPAGRAALDAILEEMRGIGLFGGRMRPEHQRDTLRRLISELRGEQLLAEW
jgi:hypothetical protein